MDILSLVMPKTDSGQGVRQRAGPRSEGGLRFEKIFEEALTGAEPPKTGKRPAAMIAGKEAIPAQPQKPADDPDETLAAGIMGNQETVVFILEGDKESATTPETSTDAIPADMIRSDDQAYQADTGMDAGVYPVTAETDFDAHIADAVTDGAAKAPAPEDATSKDAETGQDASALTDAPAGQVKTDSKTYAAVKTGNDGAKGAPVGDTAADILADSAEGEVTARMPVLRTSERHEEWDDSSGSSENGDLGPLENENDKPRVKGQKERTYSDVADAARDRAESARVHASSTPPLSQGLKPEQFRADQEMRQAAPDAPVRPGNLFDEMVSRIETMQTESARTMTIQLKPEFLGKVALEIAMDAAGLHVKISADDQGVKSMVNSQINALIETLQNKGIEVVEVEVAYTGVDNGAFTDPQEGQAHKEGSRRPRRADGKPEELTYYTALPFDALDYYLEADVSTVEYSA